MSLPSFHCPNIVPIRTLNRFYLTAYYTTTGARVILFARRGDRTAGAARWLCSARRSFGATTSAGRREGKWYDGTHATQTVRGAPPIRGPGAMRTSGGG